MTDFTAQCPECGGLWHKSEDRNTEVVFHIAGKRIVRPGIQELPVIACEQGHRFEVVEFKISRDTLAEVKVGQQLAASAS